MTACASGGVSTSSGASAAKAVPLEQFCPPHASRTGWENRVPKGKSQSRNASCRACRPIPAYAKCKLWWGEQSRGGGQNVSHAGWPGITGIRWEIVGSRTKRTRRRGTRFNDELLGRHHNDTFIGETGNDVLWGDAANAPGGRAYARQYDRLYGGAGNDWIYASKGRNTIDAGSGRDVVVAYNGHGTIDCGSGIDRVVLRKKTKYRVRHCEKVTHPAG